MEYYDVAVWRAGRLTELPSCGDEAFGEAIDERGRIAGSSWCGSSYTDEHAVLWQDGKLRDLTSPGWGYSHAYALNERGQVAGGFATPSEDTGAFVWEAGQSTELPQLFVGNGSTSALANDETGRVVGTSGGHAVLWERR